eukprot:PITA_16596
MTTFLQAQECWDTLQTAYVNSTQEAWAAMTNNQRNAANELKKKEHKAKRWIEKSVDDSIFDKIKGASTTHESWEILKAMCQVLFPNAKAINTLLGCLSQSESVKVMQYNKANEIWDKIVLSYEGDEQVKREKLQTLRIQYENLRMYNDESVANYFLRIDEIVNFMKSLGEEIKDAVVVEKVLRSLSPKFESKVSVIEEKENL